MSHDYDKICQLHQKKEEEVKKKQHTNNNKNNNNNKFFIVVVIVLGTWQLFQESFNLVTDGVPAGIEPLVVRTYLTELPGVAGVHDLHIWGMSTTETALTVHLVIPGGVHMDAFLVQISQELHHRFSIEHATVQIETGDPNYPCPLAQDNFV